MCGVKLSDPGSQTSLLLYLSFVLHVLFARRVLCPTCPYNTGTREFRLISRPSAPYRFSPLPCFCLPSRPHFYTSLGILSAVYVVGLFASLLVGTLFGPDVFERSPPAAVETNSLNVTWYGAVNGMERYHQVSTEGLFKQHHSTTRCFPHKRMYSRFRAEQPPNVP